MRWTGGAVVTASVASLVLVATVYAGGWMIMTLRDLPEYAVAGKPIQLTFMVREHGVSPLDGLTPKIAAKSGTKLVETSAVKTRVPASTRPLWPCPDPEAGRSSSMLPISLFPS